MRAVWTLDRLIRFKAHCRGADWVNKTIKKNRITHVSGPVHTATFSYENGVKLLRFCLAFTLLRSELQKVVDLPPNLKFMLSTFLILTQYIITGEQLDGVL